MTRRHLLPLVAALTACGTAPARESLPQTLGNWQRASLEDLPPDQAPPAARTLGLRRVRRAVYQGPSSVTVTVYEMNSGATPFELMQKWRVEPNTLPFYTGPYLFVIASPTGDRTAMKELANLLEKSVS